MTSQRRSPPSPTTPASRSIRFRRRPRDVPGRGRPDEVLFFLQELLDDLPVDVVVYDPAGRFVYANPCAVPDEALRRWMIGRDEREFGERRGHDPALVERRLQLAEEARRGLQPVRFEESRPLSGGGRRHSLKTFLPLTGEDGGLKRMIGYAIDITAVRQTEEQLRQSQKMEAVGRLAGGIAHDFNNLLTAINGYCDLLLDCTHGEPMRSYAQEIGAAGARAAELTAKLLALSRQQVLIRKAVGLNDLVRGLEGLLRRLIGEDVALELELATGEDEAGHVLVDPGQLEQAVLNLAINARDAMPRGGTLRLVTRRCRAPAARDPFAAGQELACLEVRDSGQGIAAEHLDHLFEPFFTTKEAGKGTGLGLAMVYAMIRQAGGDVEVESRPGHGAAFRLYFPRLATGEPSGAAPRPAGGLPRGHEKVLLVEDEPLVREIVREQLRRQGYEVVAANDAEGALRWVDAQALGSALPPFELLLSDVVMPGMSGPELAERLLERFPDLRVLFVSGYADSFTLAHGLRVAEQEILQKPFSARLLAEKVRAVLDRPPAC